MTALQNSVFFFNLGLAGFYLIAATTLIYAWTKTAGTAKSLCLAGSGISLLLMLAGGLDVGLYAAHLKNPESMATSVSKLIPWVILAPLLVWLRDHATSGQSVKPGMGMMIDAGLLALVFIVGAVELARESSTALALTASGVALVMYCGYVARSILAKNKNQGTTPSGSPALWAGVVFGPGLLVLFLLIQSLGGGYELQQLLFSLGSALTAALIAGGLLVIGAQPPMATSTAASASEQEPETDAPAQTANVAQPAPISATPEQAVQPKPQAAPKPQVTPKPRAAAAPRMVVGGQSAPLKINTQPRQAAPAREKVEQPAEPAEPAAAAPTPPVEPEPVPTPAPAPVAAPEPVKPATPPPAAEKPAPAPVNRQPAPAPSQEKPASPAPAPVAPSEATSSDEPSAPAAPNAPRSIKAPPKPKRRL